MPRYPFVVCVVDSHRIRLPYTKPPETSPNQPELSTEIFSRKLCCPECGHMFLYTERDVQWDSFQPHSQKSDSANITCWRIEIECEEDRCGIPIVFHITEDGRRDGAGIHSLITQGLSRSFFQGVICGRG